MIHAYHGNVSLPDDLRPLMQAIGSPYRLVNLWQSLRDGSTVPMGSPQNVLLGYSLGARLILQALCAGRVSPHRVVLLSAHPGLQSESERTMRIANDKEWARGFTAGNLVKVLAAWNSQSIFADSPPVVIEDIQPWRLEIAQGFAEWSLGYQPNLRPQFKKIDCPVLWMSGEQDTKFTTLAAESAPLFTRGYHHIIDECGHRLHRTEMTRTADIIRSFLHDGVPNDQGKR